MSETKAREIPLREDFSNDAILVMLAGELVHWLRAAEAAEAALAALMERPTDAETRNVFKDATQELVRYLTEWIAIHAAEKVPDADFLTQMNDIKKSFQRVDFLLIPDTTLPEDQALSGVRARVRGQAQKIEVALDRFADAIREMVAK